MHPGSHLLAHLKPKQNQKKPTKQTKNKHQPPQQPPWPGMNLLKSSDFICIELFVLMSIEI